MLTQLMETVSPRLATGYRTMLNQWSTEHLPDATLHQAAQAYGQYALGDANLPRPLLMMVGYGADRADLDRSLLAELGEVVFLPQVIRDFLAIHDDVVDGDLIKFKRPTLPAALAGLAPADHPEPAAFGRHLAIYWGDLLLGLMGDLIAKADDRVRDQLWTRVSRLLRRNQRGQLTELMLQQESPADIDADTLLKVYADKAADYCYMTPFELGAICAGLDDRKRRAARSVLQAIGTASQIIDDIAGGCPQALDHDRDTIGEIMSLRRTLLLCELARLLPAGHRLASVVAGQRATAEQAAEIREAFISLGAVQATAAHAHALTKGADLAIAEIGLSTPATEYLRDLVRTRITANLEVVIDRIGHFG